MATPSDTDLTTVAAVLAYIGGLDGSNTDVSDLVQVLVTAASAYASNFCSRDFRKQAYTESYNGMGTQRIMLRAAPVASVSAVSVDGVSIPAKDGVSYGYVSDSTGMLYLTGCYEFCRGFQNVDVTYSAGWTTPGQVLVAGTGTVTLPQDLQQAVIETVALKYKAQRSNIGIAARQIAGETISYSQADVPKSAAPVFGFYQRVGVWA